MEASIKSKMETSLRKSDWLVQKKSPASILDSDGSYQGGWFRDYSAELNYDETSAKNTPFQTWFHLSIDHPDYYISGALADMDYAGHIGLNIIDKKNHTCHEVAFTPIWLLNTIKRDKQCRFYQDEKTGSFVRLLDDQTVGFDFRLGKVQLKGTAKQCKPAFTQVTNYTPGLGIMNWWANIEVVEGEFVVEGQKHTLAPGTLGTYDRTFGHRREKQNWNWISVVGSAKSLRDGRDEYFSLQIAKDGAKAFPVVNSRKFVLWVGDKLAKLPSIQVDYDYLSKDPIKTTEWNVYSPVEKDVCVNMVFTPLFHREVKRSTPFLFESHFYQFYGTYSGKIFFEGEEFEVKDVFGIGEDSVLSQNNKILRYLRTFKK